MKNLFKSLNIIWFHRDSPIKSYIKNVQIKNKWATLINSRDVKHLNEKMKN